MPHASGGDDLAPSDEIKIYTLEGEEEKRSSAETLNDLKSSLVTEGEDKNVAPQTCVHPKSSEISRTEQLTTLSGRTFEYLPSALSFGYVVTPYHHQNNALNSMSVVNKVPIAPKQSTSPLSLMMYNMEVFQPPPAHMGISPVHIDPKTGMPRSQMYPLTPSSQYHRHPVFNPEFSQQFQWHPGNMYPMTPNFRSLPYPATVPISHNNLPKFSPSSFIHPHSGTPISHSNSSHHSIAEIRPKTEPSENSETSLCRDTSSSKDSHPESQSGKRKTHIKKPLNAFMLYMKDMRSKVVAECTLKESAAINQILGKKWRSLSGEEQAPYYAMAEKERDLHKQRYPGWSARDNYAQNTKKKKRKRDKYQDGDGNNPKKCRARFGLDQQSRWCKPCRRKKKCIRYRGGLDNTGDSEDNIDSIESQDLSTPDSKCDANFELSEDENEDSDNHLNESSELSISSPPVPSGFNSHSLTNQRLSLGIPTCNRHPLSVQHSLQPTCSIPNSPDPNPVSIPELPTPPSTDSSSAAAPPLLSVA